MRLSVLREDGLGTGWSCLVFLVALFAIWSRLPSAFSHPQFFAEDGAVWFEQAYNLGWIHSLMLPQAGYMQLFPRLIAGVTLLFPLLWAPLITNIVGAIVQALPVVVLLSRRCANWGPMPTRLVMAAAYLLLSNASEIHVVITNAMWHLTLVLALLAFGNPPKSWIGRAVDIVLFTAGALTGPFCLILFPLTLIYWWLRRTEWTAFLLLILEIGAIVQAEVIYYGRTGPPAQPEAAAPLGAHAVELLRIFAGDVILNSVIVREGWRQPALLLAAVAVAGIAIWIVCWRWTTVPMRLFFLFAFLLLGVSLRDPRSTDLSARLIRIEHADDLRYWFFPSLSFLWALAWCATDTRTRIMRYVAVPILLLATAYSLRHWEYNAWTDQHYSAYVEKFERARPGEAITFPLTPDRWTMTLVRR